MRKKGHKARNCKYHDTAEYDYYDLADWDRDLSPPSRDKTLLNWEEKEVQALEVKEPLPITEPPNDSPRVARWVGPPYEWTAPEEPFRTCPMCPDAHHLMKDCPQVRFWALLPAPTPDEKE